MNNSQSKGYTLIEILIAALLGIFVTAGAMTFYSSNKSAIQVQNGLSEIQKNGRFLIDRLTSTIQNAGYSGFYERFSSGLENTLITPTDNRWDLAFPVYGFDNVTATTVGITNITANTDVLLLKSMVNMASLVNTSLPDAMSVNVDTGFTVGDLVVATDQDRASLFQVMGVNNSIVGQVDLTIAATSSPAPGNTALLSNIFSTDAQVGRLRSQVYFLSVGDNGRSALFEGRLIRLGSATAPLAFDSKELVSDVEDMQFTYGLDTNDDGNVDRYNDAATVTTNNQWAMVRNVGITLLLASADDAIAPAANSYSYSSVRHTFVKDATAATDADRRLRRVFTMHVAMPNM